MLWALDPQLWRDLACELAGRNMTENEWANVMGDTPYEVTCDSGRPAEQLADIPEVPFNTADGCPSEGSQTWSQWPRTSKPVSTHDALDVVIMSGRTVRTMLLCVAAVAVLSAGIIMSNRPDALEGTAQLTAASLSTAPTHDGPGEVVLDSSSATTEGLTRVVGWALDSDTVEVLADGDVIATIPIGQQRMDVESALHLSDAAIGFDALVAVPTDTYLLCVARPGRLPGPDACDRTLLHLPRQRVVAFYGVLENPGLGTLGSGSIDAARRRLLTQARPYETRERPVIPAFELIATVAQAFPGDDNSYSHPIPHRDIRRALREIREVDGILVLDLQPGRDTFIEQLRPLEKFLREPDVHLALDPEWRMRAGERPNVVIGHVEAAEVNEVMEWLDALIVEQRLPRKLVVIHNFRDFMITDRDDLDPPSTVDLLVHMDGHGPPSIKTGNYRQLVNLQDAFAGFKLFYQRDFPLMTPRQVFAMDPDVDFVSYQ